MKAHPDFPQDVFDNYARLRRNPKLNKAAIGVQLRDLYPEFFAGRKGESVVRAIQTQAEDRDITIPLARPGGRPRIIPQNDARWRDQNPVLVFSYSPKVIILSDVHFPLHSPEYLTRALQVIEHREIDTVVFNGDTFDNGYLGHSGRRSHWSPSREDGIDAFRYFVTELLHCSSLKRLVALCGNHDDKVFRDSDRELEFRDHWANACRPIEQPADRAFLQVGDNFSFGDVENLVTNRYYAYMEPRKPKPWPFDGPENFPYKFTHQMEYTKFHGRVEDRLAIVDYANTYAGHHHHLSEGRAQSGFLHAVGCGTGQQPDLAPYKNARPSTHPAWNVGFVTIEHGKPSTWSIDESEESWQQRLGTAV